MSSEPLPIEKVKAAQRALWTAGDFGRIASHMTAAAEHFVSRLPPLPVGARVLDVATGTGNVALPLARAGFAVTGLDLAPNLLEQARRRAEEEGLSLVLDEGDAEALPYPEASFDAVVTMFGAMFAPRPEVAAAEMARVLRPGGLLAMGNWTPQSFSAAMFHATARHVPPPAGLPPAVLWGQESTARARLEGAGLANLHTEVVPVGFSFPEGAAGAVRLFRTYFGPTAMAFARLDPTGQEALEADLVQLWSAANMAPDPAAGTEIANEYLLVTARKP